MSALKDKIAHFYDRSTQVWLDTWGEHMHHGYYGDGQVQKDHRQAQLDLVEELLHWGAVQQADRILDAGCGVGGSARYLVERLGAKSVLGCTLSPVQAEAGNRYSEQAGLRERVDIIAQDMMDLPAEANGFDLIWSLESVEHIANKPQMLQMFYDRLAPGGKLLLATWCCRPAPPVLTYAENRLLDRIRSLYHLPAFVPLEELQKQSEAAGFEAVRTANWSEEVAPFWRAVIRSAFQLKSLRGLLQAGMPTIKGALAMRHMTRGYRKGLIQFGVLQGRKV